jgi:hypothetical protein
MSAMARRCPHLLPFLFAALIACLAVHFLGEAHVFMPAEEASGQADVDSNWSGLDDLEGQDDLAQNVNQAFAQPGRTPLSVPPRAVLPKEQFISPPPLPPKI